jgi:hypothetical protein
VLALHCTSFDIIVEQFLLLKIIVLDVPHLSVDTSCSLIFQLLTELLFSLPLSIKEFMNIQEGRRYLEIHATIHACHSNSTSVSL